MKLNTDNIEPKISQRKAVWVVSKTSSVCAWIWCGDMSGIFRRLHQWSFRSKQETLEREFLCPQELKFASHNLRQDHYNLQNCIYWPTTSCISNQVRNLRKTLFHTQGSLWSLLQCCLLFEEFYSI